MITLKNFLEKFVGHNSEIILFDEEKDLQYRKEAQSKKPEEVRLRITELFGDLPRIELFARQYADGWDCWGNDV